MGHRDGWARLRVLISILVGLFGTKWFEKFHFKLLTRTVKCILERETKSPEFTADDEL